MFKELLADILVAVRINSRHLVLEGKSFGPMAFEVRGDCCSHSEFYDFIGIEKILGHKIIKIEELDLSHNDGNKPQEAGDYDDYISHYGYRVTALHPDYDEVSAVVSFRNMSNGYYGGSMDRVDLLQDEIQQIPLVTKSVTEVPMAKEENE